MLAERFDSILRGIGMERLEYPLFYHAPAAIRYEIGGDGPVYLERDPERLTPNPAYVRGALDRATAIYQGLPAAPDILRIDGYPAEGTAEDIEDLAAHIRERAGLPRPAGAGRGRGDGRGRGQLCPCPVLLGPG